MVSKFLNELKFTTNGIRGIANEDLTPHVCMKIGLAFGHFLKPGAKVIIGTDYRISGHMIKNALVSGLTSTGVNVVDGSYTPTPALQKFVKDNPGKFDMGLIITASHNPPEFNGIKVIDADGIEIPPEKESKVEAYYKTITDKTSLPSWDQIGTLTDAHGVNNYYVDSILKNVNIDKEGSKKLNIVVDPGNGATCTYIYDLLARMGISKNACISDEPDGSFPNRVSEPTPDSLQDLSEKVIAEGASFGIGFDGDGDRAILIDNDGKFHWGDESFALILNDLLQDYKGWVVTPVSSSVLVQEVVETHGAKLEWTKVGSITVSRRMLELDAIIAGEENGGIFYKPHQPVRDGGMAL
ncbi:MAG: phosphoglucosamine mutase, partial [Candidatus Hodarchaeota archaeon]